MELEENIPFKELEYDTFSVQFLMVKDIYCKNGLKLSEKLSLFYAFLIFKAEGYTRMHPGSVGYVGYSNENLAKLYTNKWFPVSQRTVASYIEILKNENLIIIKNDGTIHRQIYINYNMLHPELTMNEESEQLKAKDKLIENLQAQLNELKAQNALLVEALADTEVKMGDIAQAGEYVRILYDKKYLTKNDNLTSSRMKDYNDMLKTYLWLFNKEEGKDFFVSLNYICKQSKNRKIKNKFTYLEKSLRNYLTRPTNIWDYEDEDYDIYN